VVAEYDAIKAMKPEKGDIFTIPLIDGDFALGQLIQYDTRGLAGYSFGLFDHKVSSNIEAQEIILNMENCFSVVLGAIDCFSKSSNWMVVGNQNLVIPKKLFPFEKLRRSKKPGSRLHGKEVIDEFVNAYYGLLPWDNYYKPDCLDEMLLSPEKKPKNLLYGKK
jgi:hypothetical protein